MEKGEENSIIGQMGEKVQDTIEKEIEDEFDNPLEETVEIPVENQVEKQIEQKVAKPIKKYKKVVTGIVISLCVLLAFYSGMTVYFMKHFYFGSEINGVNVSGKTVKDVKVLTASELNDYKLILRERGGKSEQIKAGDVGLKYNSDEEFKKLKDGQSPFKWILAIFNRKESRMTTQVVYDEKLLKERIDKLSCFDSSKVVEPKNASFQYKDNSFVIVDEVPGNKVDKDILISKVTDALLDMEAEIDLESLNCYIKPQYSSDSQKTIEVKGLLNKYSSSKITYTFGDNKEVLNGSTINKWLAVNENFEVTVDDKQAEDYIGMLSEKYDTIGTTRDFTTSSGETIQIGGGDYGWSIDEDKETQNLISAIKEGQTITKEPEYSHTGATRGSSDIGNTYAEIDLAKQHVWFYKNGSLIVEGDVVTGNVRAGNATPKGVYRLKYKEKNATLRGQGYASPVAFWMPFNGGIGMHDANWRSMFGGNIFKTNGSHGCVNCPYDVAKTIYENIEPGTPVICY